MAKFIILALLVCASAFSQAAHSVTLNWNWAQGSGGVAAGFQIQRATVSGGPYATIGTVSSATTLSYVDNSAAGNLLAEGATFFYVIEATGPGGVSAPSAEAKATIPFSPPSTPTAPTATAK